MVSQLKSMVLTLGLIDLHLTVEQAVLLSRLEETFQVRRSPKADSPKGTPPCTRGARMLRPEADSPKGTPPCTRGAQMLRPVEVWSCHNGSRPRRCCSALPHRLAASSQHRVGRGLLFPSCTGGIRGGGAP